MAQIEIDSTPLILDAGDGFILPVPQYADMAIVGKTTILYADELADGLIVMLANPSKRQGVNPSNPNDIANFYALKHNRWCKVTRLRITHGEVMFVGVYSDNTRHPWLVSKYEPFIVNFARDKQLDKLERIDNASSQD